MNAFWTDNVLSYEGNKLVELVMQAHSESAKRENISGVTAKIAAQGSGNYVQSICAAMLTTGGPHAPLVETYRLLESDDPVGDAQNLLARGERVPGWGNSFVKGAKDGLWLDVDKCLREYFPVLANKLAEVTELLGQHGKPIFPNPSAYTAAAAIALGIPAELSPYLFVAGRLDAWSEIILNNIPKGKVWA